MKFQREQLSGKVFLLYVLQMYGTLNFHLKKIECFNPVWIISVSFVWSGCVFWSFKSDLSVFACRPGGGAEQLVCADGDKLSSWTPQTGSRYRTHISTMCLTCLCLNKGITGGCGSEGRVVLHWCLIPDPCSQHGSLGEILNPKVPLSHSQQCISVWVKCYLLNEQVHK